MDPRSNTEEPGNDESTYEKTVSHDNSPFSNVKTGDNGGQP